MSTLKIGQQEMRLSNNQKESSKAQNKISTFRDWLDALPAVKRPGLDFAARKIIQSIVHLVREQDLELVSDEDSPTKDDSTPSPNEKLDAPSAR